MLSRWKIFVKGTLSRGRKMWLAQIFGLKKLHNLMQNSEYLEVIRIWYEISRYLLPKKIFFSIKKISKLLRKVNENVKQCHFANIKWTVEENIKKQ